MWIFGFLISNFFLSSFQVEFSTMFRAKSAETIRRANTTEFMRVMAVRGFSSVPSAVNANMYANRRATVCARSIRHTATSAARVASKSASKLEWIAMLCNMNVGREIQRCASKWRCSSTKTPRFDITKHFSWHHRPWSPHSASICPCPASPTPSWHHRPICPTFHRPTVPHLRLSPQHRRHKTPRYTLINHRNTRSHRHIRLSPSMPSASPPLNFSSWTSTSLRTSRPSLNFPSRTSCCCSRTHGANFSSWESLSIFCPSTSHSFFSPTNSSTPPVTNQNQKSPRRRW